MYDEITTPIPINFKEVPQEIPAVFAPGFVNTHHHEHSAPTISPRGDEMYWSRWRRPDSGLPQVIIHSFKQSDGTWSVPKIASFSGQFSDGGPVFNYKGDKLFFTSKRDVDPSKATINNIWYIERLDTQWSAPKKLASNINNNLLQACPSLAKNNNMYFMYGCENRPGNMAIAISQYEHGTYTPLKYLGPPFNIDCFDWLPFIAPDESFIIYSSNSPVNPNQFDLYIRFKEINGKWLERINLGPQINTQGAERFPSISFDGKIFFFVRNSTIYWVSTQFLKKLKQI